MSEQDDEKPCGVERADESETHAESALDEQLDDEGKKLLHEVCR